MIRTQEMQIKYNATLRLPVNPECDKLEKESDDYWKCFLRNARSTDHQVMYIKLQEYVA